MSSTPASVGSGSNVPATGGPGTRRRAAGPAAPCVTPHQGSGGSADSGHRGGDSGGVDGKGAGQDKGQDNGRDKGKGSGESGSHDTSTGKASGSAKPSSQESERSQRSGSGHAPVATPSRAGAAPAPPPAIRAKAPRRAARGTPAPGRARLPLPRLPVPDDASPRPARLPRRPDAAVAPGPDRRVPYRRRHAERLTPRGRAAGRGSTGKRARRTGVTLPGGRALL